MRIYLSESVRFWLTLVVMGGLSGGLLAFRIWYTDSTNYAFMLWNTLLAIAPWLLLFTARRWMLFERQLPALLLTFVAVLFLPNAPYMVTDLFHIKYQENIPLWFDTLMLFSFAATGLYLFYKSLRKLESILHIWFPDWLRRIAMAGVCFLSGYGIYLGRFLRFNSWDLLTDPASLITTTAGIILHPSDHSQAFGVTFFYGTALLVMYLVVRLLFSGSGLRHYVVKW